jgi:hypothetical protein
MRRAKYNYDQEGDILYISFGRSEHIVGVELGDHLLLRLDTGKDTASAPRAVGLTVLFPAQLMALGHTPTFTLERLERLPADVRAAVLEVLSKPPVSELLSMRLTLVPEELPLPELVPA